MRATALFLLLVVVSLAALLQSAASARILVLYLFGSKSHKNFAKPIAQALAEKGHVITFVSPYREPEEIPGIKQVVLDTGLDNMTSKMPNIFEFREGPFKIMPVNPLLMVDFFEDVAKNAFENKEVQALTAHPKRFDLIICNGFLNELSYGILHQLALPVVFLEPASATNWQSEFMGSPDPLSHVPNIFLKFPERMNFLQRTTNVIFTGFLKIVRDFYYLPKIHAMLSKYYKDVPCLREVERNASLLLTNGHYALNTPRPHVPAIVEVGGVHCKPPKPLPKDLLNFVESSGKHGFILFSLGSLIRGTTMPEKYRKIFLEVFAKLPQKVLWKWETETMEGLPPNVKLSKWLPQQDVLGHPKIRAFITHGGLLSIQEATYHGVPLIGIPFFGDQDTNLWKAENAGYAIKLELTSLSKETLHAALDKVLNDKSFKKKVLEVSEVFKDQQVPAVDRAVFWVEYVLRHNGARHLRSASLDLNWYQYNLLDVFLFLAAIFFLILFVTCKCLRFTYRKLCGAKKTTKAPQRKQKKH